MHLSLLLLYAKDCFCRAAHSCNASASSESALRSFNEGISYLSHMNKASLKCKCSVGSTTKYDVI